MVGVGSDSPPRAAALPLGSTVTRRDVGRFPAGCGPGSALSPVRPPPDSSPQMTVTSRILFIGPPPESLCPRLADASLYWAAQSN